MSVLDLVGVAGIPDVGISVFFRLPRTGDRINVYLADVLSLAEIAKGREAIEAGRDASGSLGEGYDVFFKRQFFEIYSSAEGKPSSARSAVDRDREGP